MKGTDAAFESSSLKDTNFLDLWRQFYPLAMSDFTMALGDTLRTVALGRFANPEITFAFIGVVRAIALCLESPVITILHASTALSAHRRSYHALGRFTLLLSVMLTIIFLSLCYQPIYQWLLCDIFGLSFQVANNAKIAFILMTPWPAAIAIRRYFQGTLIRNRQEKEMSVAAIVRFIFTACILMVGYYFALDSILIAVMSLVGAVILEALIVAYYAVPTLKKQINVAPEIPGLPVTLKAVSKYYLPLGTTSVAVWVGRAVLVAIIAHSQDGMIAVAAWTIASGFFMPVANSTRMLQQIVIAAPAHVSSKILFKFASFVGAAACLPLFILVFSSSGKNIINVLIGENTLLLQGVIPCVQAVFLLPLLIALQNYFQGRLVLSNGLWLINLATVINIAILLSLGALMVMAGMPGALAASMALMISLAVEIIILGIFMQRLG